MAEIAEASGLKVAEAVGQGARAAIGLGGGSGGEMILRIMEAQPIDFSQVLVTTLLSIRARLSPAPASCWCQP